MAQGGRTPSTGRAPPGRDPRTEIRGAGAVKPGSKGNGLGSPMQFHGGFYTDSFDAQPMRESPLVRRARLLAVTGASSGDRARTEKSGHSTAGPCLHRAPSCGGFWVYFSRTRRWRPRSKGTRGTRPGRGGFLAEVDCGQGAEAGVRVRGRGEERRQGSQSAKAITSRGKWEVI